MPRASHIKTNFSSGELSEDVDSRIELDFFRSGSLVIENFYVTVQGIIARRKGFWFLNEVKDSSKDTILISFEFSQEENYIIEFGENYFRFYVNNSIIETAPSIPYEISHPYLENEIRDVQIVQTRDVMYLAHPNHPVQKLIRLTDTTFSIADAEFINGPFTAENVISIDLLTLSGGPPWTEGSTLTLTATGSHAPFQLGHVGSLWQLKNNTDTTIVKVTAFISDTVVTVQATNDVPTSLQGSATFTWSEGEYSDARSYPAAITFHEQRLVLAGSLNEPQKLWFSRSNADYENFETGTEADDAFNITFAADKLNKIKWLVSDTVLLIGTSGAIWRAANSNNGAALSVIDLPDIKRQTTYGSSNTQPAFIADFPVYVQSGLQKIRSISYSLETEKYLARDISARSNHITGDGLLKLEYQQNPISTMWTIREDGQMPLLTYEREQQVTAWYRYTTKGKFKSIAIIPSLNNTDEVYAIVERTIEGVTKKFIEYHIPNNKNDSLNAFYVDSGLTYNGTQDTAGTAVSSIDSEALADETLSFVIGSEFEEAIVSESAPILFNAADPIFSASDVGKEIHQLPPNNGKALIVEYINPNEVAISIIEPLSSPTLEAGTWAIAIEEIFGLDHLEGETVSIAGDSATFPNKTVAGGSVTINEASSIIHIGLAYVSEQKSMPIEVIELSNAMSSSQGKEKRIDAAIIRFKETRGGQLLDKKGNVIDIIGRSTQDNMNETFDLFTGDREVTFAGNWEKEGFVRVIQAEPQPMTIKNITYKVTVNDK